MAGGPFRIPLAFDVDYEFIDLPEPSAHSRIDLVLHIILLQVLGAFQEGSDGRPFVSLVEKAVPS